MTTPAGWYPDPYDGAQLRYWDGSVWTESVTPATPSGAQPAYGQQGAAQSPGAQPPGAQPDGGQPSGAQPYGAQPAPGGGSYGQAGYQDDFAGQGVPYGSAYPQSRSGSGFGEVGEWLSAVFTSLIKQAAPMLLLLFMVPIVGFGLAAVIGRILLGEITINRAIGPNDAEVFGFNGTLFTAFVLVMVLTFVFWVIGWLAANHQMYAAHAGHQASLGQSLAVALRRLPRFIGWGLLLAIMFMVAYAAIIAVAAVVIAGAASDGGNAAILLLLLPILFVIALVGIWLWVKLAFWGVAVVVGPGGTNPFSASWGISRGRFWPTFGRLLLVGVIVWLISLVFNGILQVLFGAVAGSLFEVEPVSGDILVKGENIEDLDEIVFGDFLPSAFWFAIFAALYAVNTAVTQAVTISGAAGLYLRGGGPGEI